MNQRSEHLSDAQIEQYGKLASGAGSETEAWVETHLDDCPSCRSRVLEFRRTQFALLPGSKVNTVSSSNCPSEEELRNLAAGLCSDPLAAELTAHAAACGHCGPLLREYQEDFSDDVTPEEQTALSLLRSASPAWQRQKAREMLQQARTIVPRPSRRWIFTWRWALIPAAAAVLAAISFPIYYAQRDTPEKVEKHLALAYTEQRTIEMRIPDAKYSEFHQRRSGEPSSSSKLPESFHKAAEAISSQLKVHPNDPKWLLLSARLDLLNWQFKQALETLEKIENKDPARQLEIDSVRAMALYEKAAYDANQREGYGDAVQFLKNVLEKNPNDPVALHNQALACEKTHLYDCAIEDWNRLLTIEKDPGWAGEAQRHLDQIQEKKSPALTPSPK